MQPDIMESGTLYFFYRPREYDIRIQNLECVSCFNVVTVSEHDDLFRFLMICQKCLPDKLPDEFQYRNKNWAFVEYVTHNASDLATKMLSRVEAGASGPVNPAAPAAIAKYHIVTTSRGTELVYVLEAPIECGQVQEMFRIDRMGALQVMVKNPQGETPDEPSIDDLPQYPEALQVLFEGDWIDLLDERLLNYRSAELLLMRTGRRNIEETMGLSFNIDEPETAINRLYALFGLNEDYHPKTALRFGSWPANTGNSANSCLR